MVGDGSAYWGMITLSSGLGLLDAKKTFAPPTLSAGRRFLLGANGVRTPFTVIFELTGVLVSDVVLLKVVDAELLLIGLDFHRT